MSEYWALAEGSPGSVAPDPSGRTTGTATVNRTRIEAIDYGTCYTFRTAHRRATAVVLSDGRLSLSAGTTWTPGDDSTFRTPRHYRDEQQAFGWLAVALNVGIDGADLRRHGFEPAFGRFVGRERLRAQRARERAALADTSERV